MRTESHEFWPIPIFYMKLLLLVNPQYLLSDDHFINLNLLFLITQQNNQYVSHYRALRRICFINKETEVQGEYLRMAWSEEGNKKPDSPVCCLAQSRTLISRDPSASLKAGFYQKGEPFAIVLQVFFLLLFLFKQPNKILLKC